MMDEGMVAPANVHYTYILGLKIPIPSIFVQKI
jgi:hypothetical protein